MKTLILVVLIAFACTLRAQIVFTRADYGSNGDKVIYAVDSPVSSQINFGASGANYSWNFIPKYLNVKRYDSTQFIDASSDPNAPGVSTNMLLRTAAFDDQYLDISDSFIKMIVDLPSFKVSGVKLKLMKFPLTYQSFSADSATNIIAKGTFVDFNLPPQQGIDSIMFKAKVYVTTVCDGWGKITIPDSSSYNSLRITNTVNIIADIYIHNSVIPSLPFTYFATQVRTNSTYQWYAPGSKSYVASVGLDTSGNIASFTYKVKQAPEFFNYKGGKLLSIFPDSAFQGEKLMVTIKATGTHFTRGNTVFYIGNMYTDSVFIINDTTLTGWVRSNLSTTPGMNGLQVYDPIQSVYLNNCFKLLASPIAPRLTSVNPASGSPGQIEDITLAGSYTHFKKGAMLFFNPQTSTPGNIAVISFSIINDSLITAKIVIDSLVKPNTQFLVRVSSIADGNLNWSGFYTVINTGMDEISSSPALKIYPNPADDIFYMKDIKDNSLIEISNMLGQIVLRSLSTASPIYISHIPEGVYWIKAMKEGQVTTGERLWIKR